MELQKLEEKDKTAHKMAESEELKLFDARREALSDLLINSIDSFSSHCFAARLVLDDIEEKATDELAQTRTNAQKAQRLLRLVMKKMNEMGDAATVWKHFLTSIEDMVDVHKYLSMIYNNSYLFIC